MRPRDAAAWLSEGRLDAAFISTDTALENEIEDWPTLELNFSRSDLVVAVKEDSPFQSLADLSGRTVATHLPGWSQRWMDNEGVDANVVHMGGSLEGVCAVGLADAIVDLRETGGSLQRNRLRVLAEGHQLPSHVCVVRKCSRRRCAAHAPPRSSARSPTNAVRHVACTRRQD